MRFDFIPIDYDAFDYDERNLIKIVGRTSKGEKICLVDDYEPNFWVILKKEYEKKAEEVAKKISKVSVTKKSRSSHVTRCEIEKKKFLGNDVLGIRVFVTNHKDAHDIASEIGDMNEIEFRREHDLPLITKYIKEKKMEPMNWYTVEGETLGFEDLDGFSEAVELKACIKIKNFKPSEKEHDFTPRILAFDIESNETEIGKGEVLMVSLFGENFKKVLTWKKCSIKQDYVECLKDEAEMIDKFVEYVKEYDPDILTGYFSDGFDLPYLKSACVRNRTKLTIGLDGCEPYFTRGKIITGKIFGIVHVDLFRFISAVFSQYLQSETLSLNEVANELIGNGKDDFDFSKLTAMKEDDWRDFFAYNLKDAEVTYQLANKLWPDILAFTKVIKEPLFNITRNRMSSHVENYIIHNLDRFNEIAEKRPLNDEISQRRSLGKYEGAFVLQPKPGFYEDLAVFDFTSMHASIIVSFNLSKSTLLKEKEGNAYETPEFEYGGRKSVFYFTKETGFFPKLLGEVVELRKKYKKEYNKNQSNLLKARSNAYKLLANASYGYQGFFGARYYCREAAASTLAFVRSFTTESINKIKDAGYGVIFSDTDSIGFELKGKSKAETKEFLKKLNLELPGIMELDLEDFYKRGLFVAKRTTKEGAKKKYALLKEDDNVKIRGFETVRRDWCRLTRDLQSDVLRSILGKGNEKEALELLKETVKKLKERKVEIKDIMIRTQLRRDVNEYLAEGPHVIAAKKMKEKDVPVRQGMLIEYYIGEGKGKGKRISDKVLLPDENGKYDIDYYLNNQILPSVENIFDVFGINVKEIVDGEVQKKLF